MKHAISVPNFGSFGDVHELVEFAAAADQAGWDGFYLWDHLRSIDIAGTDPVLDPWIAMAAIACNTTNIRIGTLVTPLARRRPGKMARETVTLDHLSNGRLVLGAGIGGDFYREFTGFGEPDNDRRSAEMLDEALEILTQLWSGETVNYSGKHYRIEEIQFNPPPVQQPRIPIWLAGVWPGKKPFRRAAQWDGICPLNRFEGPLKPDAIRSMLAYIHEHRTSDAPFDVAITTKSHTDDDGGEAPTDEYLTQLRDWEESGVTWAIEGFPILGDKDAIMATIKQGPPRI